MQLRSSLLWWATVALVVICGIIKACDALNIQRKKLAGPPSEFSMHRIPETSNGVESERSVEFIMEFADPQPGVDLAAAPAWRQNVAVDSETRFSLFFLSPHAHNLRLELRRPDGHYVKDLAAHGRATTFPLHSSSAAGAPGTVFVFDRPPTGMWLVEAYWREAALVASAAASTAGGRAAQPKEQGILIAYSAVDLEVEAYLHTYGLVRGARVGLHARMAREGALLRQGRDVFVSEANMEVEMPDGRDVDVPMNDAGELGDAAAGDSTFSATLTASETGTYLARAVLAGTDDAGRPFQRSTQHVFVVVDDSLALTGVATAGAHKGTDRIPLDVGVRLKRSHAELHALGEEAREYRVYAEVEGTSTTTARSVSVAWVGGVVVAELQATDHLASLRLELDAQWLARAGAAEPLTLRNVWVQELTHSVPVAQHAGPIPVAVQAAGTGAEPISAVVEHRRRVAADPARWGAADAEPTTVMLMGERPAESESEAAAGAGGKLILVHGYCSSENPFEQVKEQFTDAMFFLNKDGNVSNDHFARLLLAFAEGVPSYALIGHSQGGMAIATLFNYYWSGADHVGGDAAAAAATPSESPMTAAAAAAAGTRILQSVGTPYQGNSIAGTAAGLGKLFGVGCGSNTDLTRDGAQLWAAGITAHTRAQITYFRTKYPGDFGQWCQFGSGLVMKKPNDGVAELAYTSFEGATDGGVKDKWCHSEGMRYTNQCRDPERNAEMNAQAKRG